jgi:putative membrane protein
MAHPATGAFSWTSGTVHPEVVLGTIVIGAAWLAAHVARGEPLPRARALAFFTGLATFLGALSGPLHDAAEFFLFSAHMVQHLLLTLVGVPLLLAGTPTWMGDALLGGGRRRWLVRGLTRPVPALGLYSIALAGWHFPGPYDLALAGPAWHVMQHATLVLTATLAWWPVLGPSTVAPRIPYGAQILYLFVLGIPMTVVAALVTGAERPLYEFYVHAPRITLLDPLEDQRLGGLIMWVPAGLIPLVAFTAVFFRWAAAEREDARDESPAPP